MPQANQTEQATPRRREKAREKGQIARSRDLIGASSGVAATLILFTQMAAFPQLWRAFLRDCLEGAASGSLRLDALQPFVTHLSVFAATAAALGLGWIVAVSSAVAQGGLVFAPASLLPMLSRISPAARMRQLFSITALRSLLKSLLPAGAVVYIAVVCLRRDWSALMTLASRNARGLAGFTASRVFEMGWKSAFVLLLWAFLDYLFERRHFESELRMSRQELVDEYKETEGNPQIKARVRRLQRQMRRRKMLEDAKRAAVVVTNPTAYAVALEYNALMPAPVVVAKGRNLLAAEIREVARWNNIPIVENKPLAHLLYRTVEIGQTVPPKLYAVVERLCGKASLPMPKLYLIPEQAPNAFATGRNPNHASVAATVGLMELMNEEELEGVIAHELSHVRNYDILTTSVAATLAAAITFLARMAMYAEIFGGGARDDDDRRGGALGAVLMIFLAPLAALLLQLMISRRREYAADESGARLVGHPYGLISALEKLGAYNQRIPMDASPATSSLYIVKPLSAGGIANLFSTHPPLEDRIAVLRQMTAAR
jgi:flagellar biosynthesis protein FlhB